MGKALDKLKSISIKIVNFQIKLLLLIIYFIVIFPYGIFFFIKNFLAFRKSKRTSSWIDVAEKKQTIETLRRQF